MDDVCRRSSALSGPAMGLGLLHPERGLELLGAADDRSPRALTWAGHPAGVRRGDSSFLRGADALLHCVCEIPVGGEVQRHQPPRGHPRHRRVRVRPAHSRVRRRRARSWSARQRR